MAWFTADASDFFAELELNNNRDWFEKNKKRYEASVKTPMNAFAAEMIARMQQIDPQISMLPRNAVFRIHRDTRFSRDSKPYKTNAGMVVSRGGRHEPGVTGLYFHLDAQRMAVASGLYFLEPPQLRAVREHISRNLEEFAALLADPNFVRHFGELAGEKNKVLPADLREAATKQPLLYNKQFFYWAEYETAEALREDLPDFLMSHMAAALPLNGFLCLPLGPLSVNNLNS